MGGFLGAQYFLSEDRPQGPKTLRNQASGPGIPALGSAVHLPWLLTRLPVLVLAWNEQGRLVAWNHEAERVLGYLAEEILAGEPANLPEDIRELGRIVQESRGRQGSPRAWEQRVKTKGGQIRVLHWSFPPITLPVPGWHCWVLGLPAPEGN